MVEFKNHLKGTFRRDLNRSVSFWVECIDGFLVVDVATAETCLLG